MYASFQHDRSAVHANTAMGWQNVMWGSDYPHYEGTYGHTQKTLHELFDDCPPEASHRIRIGAFQELFPHVPPRRGPESARGGASPKSLATGREGGIRSGEVEPRSGLRFERSAPFVLVHDRAGWSVCQGSASSAGRTRRPC